MPELQPPKAPILHWESVRDEWVRAVETLVMDVESWCKANDWPTRRIEKRAKDSQIGEYVVPALLIQADIARIMLEPVARFVPGSDGLVDLYLMPAYDDIASLFWHSDGWQVHYASGDGAAVAAIRDLPARPLTEATFTDLVNEMASHARA